jgi:hypothetical protein
VGRVLPSPFCYHSAVGYSLAAQFQTESSADRAYRQVTRDLSRMRAELSAFQFEDAPYWYVAVVGDSEDIGVFSRLARHLSHRSYHRPPRVYSRRSYLLKRESSPHTTSRMICSTSHEGYLRSPHSKRTKLQGDVAKW